MKMDSYYCPCIVCNEVAGRPLPDISVECVPIGKRTSFRSVDTATTTAETFALDFEIHGVRIGSGSPGAIKSIRLSMDGSLNEQVSMDDTTPADCPQLQEPQPQVQQRGNRPRRQRRCSVTQFNLEDAVNEVRNADQAREERNKLPESSPQLQSPRPPRSARPRRQRRCSVTQFSLDDTISGAKNVDQAQEEKPGSSYCQQLPRYSLFNLDHSLQEVQTEEQQPSLPREDKPKDGDGPGQGLVTKESQQSFRAKVSWGRAA
jgi:hypothetical protein